MKKFLKKIFPNFLISWYHFFLALLGAVIYRFPSRKIKVIGVTGTNGKTTTTEMIAKIFEEAGFKTATISSIKFKIGDKEWLNELRMTMPGRFKIQRFLREAVNKGCSYLILEVTSEGIAQYRHKFIDFEAAVFTNLSPEHIEAHKGFENYKKAKGSFFNAVKKIHILNLDDENINYFLQFPAEKKFGYQIKNNKEHASAVNFVIEAEKIKESPKTINFFVKEKEFQLNLTGKFNVSNALAAICVGLSQGLDLAIMERALRKIEKIPGRMELIIEKPFKVYIDYAFTPNALGKIYQSLSCQLADPSVNKLICVLGAAGGGRDKWKRPVLGEIAGKYCNEVIVTNEDPYDEDPWQIIEQVAKGAENININQLNQHKSTVYKILDRREAIKKVLKLAKEGDIIVITGKGCEPSICVADNKKIPWNEKQVVREEFEKLKF